MLGFGLLVAREATQYLVPAYAHAVDILQCFCYGHCERLAQDLGGRHILLV